MFYEICFNFLTIGFCSGLVLVILGFILVRLVSFFRACIR